MFDILFSLMILFLVVLAIVVMFMPVVIANARGVSGGDMAWIVILSVLGIFFGFTWICALVMAFCFGAEPNRGDNLNKLATAARLYKDKAISKSEYEKLKKKLLDK